MVTIYANNSGITIKNNDKIESFPLGSFMIRKIKNLSVRLNSSISNDSYDIEDINTFNLKLIKLTIADPTEKTKGNYNDIILSKESGKHFIYNGPDDGYILTNQSHVTLIFMQKLISVLNTGC